MNAYNEVIRGVQWVLNNCTSYQVAKDLGITNRTVNRYQNGETPLENMSLATAERLFNYYLKERLEMNIESLEQAIKDFNEWGKGARIYLDITDGYFNTDVYHNDGQMNEAYPAENFFGVYSKDELEGHIKIGVKRRAYIEKYARLILDGWSPMQAQDYMMDKFV